MLHCNAFSTTVYNFKLNVFFVHQNVCIHVHSSKQICILEYFCIIFNKKLNMRVVFGQIVNGESKNHGA